VEYACGVSFYVANRRRFVAAFALLPLLLLLTACPRPVSQPTQSLQKPLSIAADARRFRILPAESQLILRVYREGRLARLGHNHVISTQQLAGDVYLAGDILQSSAELRLAVNDLEVDRADLRAQEGPDFSAPVNPDAIAGTRSNMLGEQQLNASVWPDIIMRSRGVTGAYPMLALQVEINIQGRLHTLVIPVQLQRDEKWLRASAEFSFRQTELGLVPFSVMLGALQVRDQIDARLLITAQAD